MIKKLLILTVLIISSLALSIFLTNASSINYGDINNDGKINTTDEAYLARYVLGIMDVDKSISDLNGDNKINTTDVSILNRFILGIISEFPIIKITSPPTTTPLSSNFTKSWIATWASSQQLTESNNMPPSPGLSGNTLRQMFHVSIPGNILRIQFSNEFGNSVLSMKSVHIAVSTGSGNIKTDTDKTLLFGGNESIDIPVGKTVLSDEISFNLDKLSDISVTILFGNVPSSLTGHPGSRTTSYIATGNKVTSQSMVSSVTTDHWYVVSGIDVYQDTSYSAVVALGDSITDGRGSTTNANNRWPDILSKNLQSNSSTSKVAVINQGVGGNTVLSGGLGVTALKRFDRDVLDIAGVKSVIILEGVNDIGNTSDTSVPDKLIEAYKTFISKSHAKNIKVYGVPILPFGGSSYYSDSHESMRTKVNTWIRTSGAFDKVIDLDAAVRNPNDTKSLQSIYDSGDHLHLNPDGYKKMADMIDLSLFSN